MSPRLVPLGGGATALVLDEPHGSFWDIVADGRFEPPVTRLILDRLGPGTTFVDIGAWIGCYTLLAAERGADVVAYEPDPVALTELQGNVALNPALAARVTVRAEAVSRRSGRAVLSGGEHGLGSSLSRLADAGASAGGAGLVPVVTVDARAVGADPTVRAAALVKIDIEGSEYTVVPRLVAGLGTARPPLLVSLHGFELRAWAERPGRLLRLPVARLRGTARKGRLLWSLRAYRLSVLGPEAGTPRRLTGLTLLGFCARLAEADLLAEPR